MIDENCPNCQSDDISYNSKRQQYRCEDCDYKWQETTASEAEYCQALANSDNWQNLVIDEWPAPIAHEYQRLQTLLSKGSFIAAMLQLKDLAEILIKFHTICMYQWLKTHKPEQSLDDTMPSIFKILSMGAWYNLSGQLAKLIIKNHQEDDDPLGSYLAHYFYNPKRTKINILLDELVEWRNNEIGHGAFRLNTKELWTDFEGYLQRLHDCILINDPWQQHQLFIEKATDQPPQTNSTDNNATLLVGSKSIRAYHNNLSPIQNKHHILSANALYITDKSDGNNQANTPLSPLVQAHTCSVCELQDVFIFDSHDSYKGRFYYLDYLAGHRIKLQSHQSPRLNQSYQQAKLVDFNKEDETINKNALNASVVDLLKEKSLEANYVSPKYLQQPLASFIKSHDKGLFWLTAPAHIGKSIFVHGIANNLDKTPMLDDLIAIRFHIRREFRYFAHHMIESFGEQLKNKFNLTSGNQQLPQIDTSLGQLALVSWLNAWWQLSPYRHNFRLLVAIDGLDEIGKRQDKDNQKVMSILDLLPTGEVLAQLNPDIYLLLTSRPVQECPSWMQEQLDTQLSNFKQNTLSQQLAVDLQYPDYTALLHKYMTNKLGQQFTEIKDSKAKQAKTEKLFSTLLNKSEHRFLYFSLLVDIIKEQNLNLAQLQQMPEGANLYEHFIKSLEHKLGGKNSKHFLQVKQLLTLLTACEQAAVMDAQIMQESASSDDFVSAGTPDAGQIVWQGLDLATIAGLLNESAGQHATQLIFTLYTLKSLLKVDRSETQAQYCLGLKELAGYINDKWSDEVLEWHRQISEPFYYTWKDRWDELDMNVPENYYQIRYLLGHVNMLSSTKSDILNQLVFDRTIHEFQFKQFERFNLKVNYKSALGWITFVLYLIKKQIAMCRIIVSNDFKVNELNNDLATAYMNRANLHLQTLKIKEALTDYQAAINLRTNLQYKLGDSCPYEWQNSMVNLLNNRGSLYAKIDQFEKALSDYNTAIDIGQTLLQKVAHNSQNEWIHDLAWVYMNRGSLYKRFNKPNQALSDYETYMNIINDFLNKVGDNVSNNWKYRLANAYMNHGSLYADLYQSEKAFGNYKAAIDIVEKLQLQLGNDFPRDWHNSLAQKYSSLGTLYETINKKELAIEKHQKAMNIKQDLKKILGKNFPMTWEIELVRILIHLGNLHLKLNKPQKALTNYKKAIDIQLNLQNKSDKFIPNEWINQIAGIYMNCADCYADLNQIENALVNYQTAIDIRQNLQQKLGDDFQSDWENDLASVYMNRGLLNDDLHQIESAIKDYQTAIDIRQNLQQKLGDDFQSDWENDLASVYINRANLFKSENQFKKALEDYNTSIAIHNSLQKRMGNDFLNIWLRRLAMTYSSRGKLHQVLEELEKALSDYQQVIYIFENSFDLIDDCQHTLSESFFLSACIYRKQGKYEEFEEFSVKSIDLWHKLVMNQELQRFLKHLIYSLLSLVNYIDSLIIMEKVKKIIQEIHQTYPVDVLTEEEKQALDQLEQLIASKE